MIFARLSYPRDNFTETSLELQIIILRLRLIDYEDTDIVVNEQLLKFAIIYRPFLKRSWAVQRVYQATATWKWFAIPNEA